MDPKGYGACPFHYSQTLTLRDLCNACSWHSLISWSLLAVIFLSAVDPRGYGQSSFHCTYEYNTERGKAVFVLVLSPNLGQDYIG